MCVIVCGYWLVNVLCMFRKLYVLNVMLWYSRCVLLLSCVVVMCGLSLVYVLIWLFVSVVWLFGCCKLMILMLLWVRLIVCSVCSVNRNGLVLCVVVIFLFLRLVSEWIGEFLCIISVVYLGCENM